MKICTKCKIEKNELEFYKDSNQKDGFRSHCKGCVSIYRKTPSAIAARAKYWKSPKGKVQLLRFRVKPEGRAVQRRGQLKYKYNITPEQYEAMLVLQNYKCAICKTDSPGGSSNKFHIDHDHLTKQIRGLLCHSCNVGQGFFKDDPELLIIAANYLLKYKTGSNV